MVDWPRRARQAERKGLRKRRHDPRMYIAVHLVHPPLKSQNQLPKHTRSSPLLYIQQQTLLKNGRRCCCCELMASSCHRRSIIMFERIVPGISVMRSISARNLAPRRARRRTQLSKLLLYFLQHEPRHESYPQVSTNEAMQRRQYHNSNGLWCFSIVE